MSIQLDYILPLENSEYEIHGRLVVVDLDQVCRDPVREISDEHLGVGKREERLDQPRTELVGREVGNIGQNLVNDGRDNSSRLSGQKLLQEMGGALVLAKLQHVATERVYHDLGCLRRHEGKAGLGEKNVVKLGI